MQRGIPLLLLGYSKPALQIQDSEAPTYNNVFFSFGVLHIVLAHFGALGYFLNCSGGPQIFTETGVLASGSLSGFIYENKSVIGQ